MRGVDRALYEAARLRRRVVLRRDAVRLRRQEIGPWRRAQVAIADYDVATVEQLKVRRRSDTVYIFGSGASLNAITPNEWAAVAEHDTFGLNWFVRQAFVRCDFHLVRGVSDSTLRSSGFEADLMSYFSTLAENPCFAEAVLLVQPEQRAAAANVALARGLMPRRPILPFTTAPGDVPSRHFEMGLTHSSSTLHDAINAAWLLGWKRIVLVGVDLYDRRYFWLGDDDVRGLDRERGAVSSDAHSQVDMGFIERIGTWASILAEEGCTLEVLNPRSLLTHTLPTHALLPKES